MTLANWAAKTGNLLRDELGAGPGSRVAVLLPAHWQTSGVLLGIWYIGAEVVLGQDDCDIACCTADRLDEADAAVGPMGDVVALLPRRVRQAGPRPPVRHHRLRDVGARARRPDRSERQPGPALERTCRPPKSSRPQPRRPPRVGLDRGQPGAVVGGLGHRRRRRSTTCSRCWWRAARWSRWPIPTRRAGTSARGREGHRGAGLASSSARPRMPKYDVTTRSAGFAVPSDRKIPRVSSARAALRVSVAHRVDVDRTGVGQVAPLAEHVVEKLRLRLLRRPRRRVRRTRWPRSSCPRHRWRASADEFPLSWLIGASGCQLSENFIVYWYGW